MVMGQSTEIPPLAEAKGDADEVQSVLASFLACGQKCAIIVEHLELVPTSIFQQTFVYFLVKTLHPNQNKTKLC